MPGPVVDTASGIVEGYTVGWPATPAAAASETTQPASPMLRERAQVETVRRAVMIANPENFRLFRPAYL